MNAGFSVTAEQAFEIHMPLLASSISNRRLCSKMRQVVTQPLECFTVLLFSFFYIRTTDFNKKQTEYGSTIWRNKEQGH